MELKDRNIYNSLPQIFGQFVGENGQLTDSAYLVEYFEIFYNNWNNSLSSILNFDSLDDLSTEQLDYLAPFFGFTDKYYDVNWTDEIKVKLFSGVYKDPYLWRFRGSENVWNYMCNTFGIIARITRDSGFIAGISKANDICGYGSSVGEIVIKYPNSYFDDTLEKARIDWLIDRGFIPVNIHITLRPVEGLI